MSLDNTEMGDHLGIIVLPILLISLRELYKTVIVPVIYKQLEYYSSNFC